MPWWQVSYAWGIALLLMLLGFAWHDLLKGRYPYAPYAATAVLAASAWASATFLPNFHAPLLVLGLCVPIGWGLRSATGTRGSPVPWTRDVGVGVTGGFAVGILAAAWTPQLRGWAFGAVALIGILRLLLLDPYLRRRARLAGEAPVGE